MADIIIHKAHRGRVLIEAVSEAGRKFMQTEFIIAPSATSMSKPEEAWPELHQLFIDNDLDVDLR